MDYKFLGVCYVSMPFSQLLCTLSASSRCMHIILQEYFMYGLFFHPPQSSKGPFLMILERFSYDLEKWFRYSVRYLFHQPISEKIKTWPLHFPTKENPNMEKALFD